MSVVFLMMRRASREERRHAAERRVRPDTAKIPMCGPSDAPARGDGNYNVWITQVGDAANAPYQIITINDAE